MPTSLVSRGPSTKLFKSSDVSTSSDTSLRPTASLSKQSCSGWDIQSNSFWVSFSGVNVDYATAKKNCEAAGMTLAMPTTAAQLKDLKSAVGKQLTGTSFLDFN